MDLSDTTSQLAAEIQSRAVALRALAVPIEGVEPQPEVGEIAISDRLRAAVDSIDAAAVDLLGLVPEIDEAEYVEPPPPPPPSGWVEAAIAGMQPGEFRLLDPDITWMRTATQAYWTNDWTPRMHWDTARQQIVKFGHRLFTRAVAYAGAWREFPLPADYTQISTSGHWYGWSAHDGADRILAKEYLIDLATETHTKIAPIPVTTNGSNGTMMAWLASVGRFARFGGDADRWMEYDPATNNWPVVVSPLPHGQHALVEYNDVDGCCLMLGGNDNKRAASLVHPGGSVTPLPPLPQETGMTGGGWVIPLQGGGWLVKSTGTDLRLWSISAADPAWVDRGPWPKIGLGYNQVAHAPEHGVIFVATTTGLHVYKLSVA